MPIFKKSPQSGDPLGQLTIHCPEEVLRAERGKDGMFTTSSQRGSSVSLLVRRGWRLCSEAITSGSQAPPKTSATVRPPKASKAKVSKPKAVAPPSIAPSALGLLDGSVSEIETGLATGGYDSDLDEMIAAEKGGKTRKSAIAALKARKSQL